MNSASADPHAAEAAKAGQTYDLECAPRAMIAVPTGPAWDAACLETNWLVYKLAPKNGKLVKLPANQGGAAPTSVYAAASLTLSQAHTAAKRLGPGFGIGYLPRPGSALIGIDLDNAIAPWDDEPDPWAAELLKLCPSWAEVSPSGTGIRVIAARRGSPEVDREKDGMGYFGGGGRFFTVTFNLLPGRGSFICSVPALVNTILKQLDAEKATEATTPLRGVVNGSAPHWFDQLPEERQCEEVERMLACLIDPKFGDYDLWLKVSFAVYAATDSMGFDIWDRWCRGLPGYDAAANVQKWASGFHPIHKISVGTLIHYARQHGYKVPAGALERLHGARLRTIAQWLETRR